MMKQKHRRPRTGAACAAAILSTLFLAHPASARLGISLKPDRTAYVRYENIKLTVTLSNYTANKIRFGSAQDEIRGHLTFSVSRDEGESLRRVHASNLLQDLELRPGQSRQIQVSANDMYNFQAGGKFLIYAQVGHRRLPTDYRSQTINLQVRDGIKLWSRDIGVPVGSASEPIPVRQVKLMQVHEDDEDIYCIRIEDDKNVYAVMRLGQMIQGEMPSCLVDAVSNIHILLRLRSHLFVHRVYDYRGRQLQAKYYMMAENKPQLYRDSGEGTVTVVGGRPARLGDDYVLNSEGANPVNALPDAIRRRPSRLDQ